MYASIARARCRTPRPERRRECALAVAVGAPAAAAVHPSGAAAAGEDGVCSSASITIIFECLVHILSAVQYTYSYSFDVAVHYHAVSNS